MSLARQSGVPVHRGLAFEAAHFFLLSALTRLFIARRTDANKKDFQRAAVL